MVDETACHTARAIQRRESFAPVPGAPPFAEPDAPSRDHHGHRRIHDLVGVVSSQFVDRSVADHLQLAGLFDFGVKGTPETIRKSRPTRRR
jgi:hypothetical protein